MTLKALEEVDVNHRHFTVTITSTICPSLTHTHTHARTHARTHTHTHTRTHSGWWVSSLLHALTHTSSKCFVPPLLVHQSAELSGLQKSISIDLMSERWLLLYDSTRVSTRTEHHTHRQRQTWCWWCGCMLYLLHVFTSVHVWRFKSLTSYFLI